MLLLAAYTVLVEPFVRTNFYRMLKRQLATEPGARILYYRTQILWEWSWMVVLVVILIPVSEPLTWIGLSMPDLIGWIILAVLLAGIALSIYLLQRNPRSLAAMKRSLEGSAAILPTTPAERKWYTAAAITAGICEELLYRGFLIHFLYITFPGIDFLFLAILSGFIYGLSRAYQGIKGILQTSLMGFSYAIIYFLSGNLISAFSGAPASGITGSVIPVIVFHAAAELRPLFLWQPEVKAKKRNQST